MQIKCFDALFIVFLKDAIVDDLERLTLIEIVLDAGLDSAELGIPLRRLSKLFIKETGMPYTRYVLHKRISESCSLLTESDESIEFIAGYVGFSDSKAFRARFKETVGISPRDYRKTNKA